MIELLVLVLCTLGIGAVVWRRRKAAVRTDLDQHAAALTDRAMQSGTKVDDIEQMLEEITSRQPFDLNEWIEREVRESILKGETTPDEDQVMYLSAIVHIAFIRAVIAEDAEALLATLQFDRSEHLLREDRKRKALGTR